MQMGSFTAQKLASFTDVVHPTPGQRTTEPNPDGSPRTDTARAGGAEFIRLTDLEVGGTRLRPCRVSPG